MQDLLMEDQPLMMVDQDGIGRVYRHETVWAGRSSGGGTGNPGGDGAIHTSGSLSNEGNAPQYKGNDGTGGLLILFASKYNNQGKIEANGVDSTNSHDVEGGASGGGSINIFYYQLINNTSCLAEGGKTSNHGGEGGNGSVAMGTIESGSYVEKGK